MSAIVAKAIEAIGKLPPREQEVLAREVLARIQADARWDQLFADPRSEALLDRLAREADEEIARGDVVDLTHVLKPAT